MVVEGLEMGVEACQLRGKRVRELGESRILLRRAGFAQEKEDYCEEGDDLQDE
jgi:hypothetical protein